MRSFCATVYYRCVTCDQEDFLFVHFEVSRLQDLTTVGSEEV